MARGSPDPGLSCCSGEGPRTLPGLPLGWRAQWTVTWGVVNSAGCRAAWEPVQTPRPPCLTDQWATLWEGAWRTHQGLMAGYLRGAGS